MSSVSYVSCATRGISERISRADVAALLVDEATKDRHSGHSVGIKGLAEAFRRFRTEAANHA